MPIVSVIEKQVRAEEQNGKNRRKRIITTREVKKAKNMFYNRDIKKKCGDQHQNG